MPIDQSLVGRSFPQTRPYAVSEDGIRAFVTATGGEYDGGPAPATYPIVVAFDAMNDFLEAEQVDLVPDRPRGAALQLPAPRPAG